MPRNMMFFNIKINMLLAMCGLDNENIVENTTLNIEIIKLFKKCISLTYCQSITYRV